MSVKLKGFVENLEEIPESLRQFYEQDEKSGQFVLQAEGFVPSKKLSEFRDNNTDLAKRVARYEEDMAGYRALGEDVKALTEEVTRLRKLDQKMADQELVDKKGFDSALAQRTEQMKADFEGKVAALKSNLDAVTREREEAISENKRIVVSGEIARAAVKHGVLPDALSVLQLQADAAGWTRNDKGEVVLFDRKTNSYVYGANGADPISPEEWILGLKSGAGRFFFNQPTGGGASGSDQGAGGKNPWSKDGWDDTAQAQLYKADPLKAEQLAKAAGSYVGALPPNLRSANGQM